MRNWRQLTAAVGGAALTLGVLVAPSLANHADPQVEAAAVETPGGIEIWGNQTASLPEADGPWKQLGAHEGTAAAANQLAIRADGTLQALPGTATGLASFPSAVADATVVDAGISHPQMAWAVTSDGNLHKWGGARGTVIPDGTVTPADLDASGRTIVEAAGHANGASLLVRLDDGAVRLFDALGSVTPLNAGEPLSGVTSLDAAAGGQYFALRSDGSIASVTAGGWTTAVPADADPVVGIAVTPNGAGTAVRASGAVLAFSESGASTDAGFEALTGIEGRPVQVARAGQYAALRTSTGEVYAWWAGSTSAAPAAFQPPAALDGMDVVDLQGGIGVFRAIVVESDLPDLSVTTQPTIAGTPTVGRTLTATPATFSETEGVSITHQWFADGAPIGGATSETYVLTAAEEGATITYVSTANRAADGATLPSDPSNGLGPVAAGFQIIEEPTILGDPFIGETLVAELGATNGNRPQNSLQWQAGDGETFENIDGATSALFVVPAELDGQYIRYIQTAKAGSDTATRESEVVGPVREAPVELAVEEQPTIEGDGQVGETLTATPATFTDDEGVTLVHQWFADGELIEGASETTLTLGVDQEGATITYSTSATRAIDGAEVTSEPSNEIGPITPVDLTIVGQPTITGQPFIGQTLTVTPADVSDDRAVTTYQWWAGEGDTFTEIEGATGETLEVTEALRGQQIRVEQIATRALDEARDTAESIAVGPVTDAPVELTVTSEAELSGTPRVGQTLTGTPATFSTTEGVTVTNYWVIGTTEVAATGTTLTLTDEHVRQNIQFKSVATRGEESVPSTSNTVGPVLVVLAATADPTISGDAQVGATLTGTPATFNDTEGVTVANQWLADGEPIAGATGISLTLSADQVGQVITFRSTATRGADTVPATSAPTAAVAPKPLGVSQAASISGTAQVGQTLTGTPAVFDDDTATVTNQWLADGEAIDGATGTTLELTSDMVGKEITFVSTAVRGEETLESSSEEVGPVTPGSPGGLEGEISLKPVVVPGEVVTITVGEDYAGQEVKVWMFSTPREIGSGVVTADGTLQVTIPLDATLGAHQIAVYDENGDLIGFQAITVVAPDGAGGSGSGSGSGDSGGRSGSLPDAGAGSFTTMLPLGLALLIAGLGLLGFRRTTGQRRLG